VVERETLSAEQQRDYLALLSSRGGELRERYQIRKEGVRTPTVAHLSRRLPCGAAGETSTSQKRRSG